MARKRACNHCGKLILELSECACEVEIKRKRNKEKTERSSEDAKFLQSKKWRKFAGMIKDRDGRNCQRCMALNSPPFDIVTEDLTVHHIKPRIKYNGKNGYPDLRYEESNCVTVCRSCNAILGTKGKLDFPFAIEEQSYFL